MYNGMRIICKVLLTLPENDNIMDSQKKQRSWSIDERIATTEAAISTLTEELKAKKAELKELTKAKAAAEKLAAEKKAEEDKAKLLDAIAASGKSIDEIIDMIGK